DCGLPAHEDLAGLRRRFHLDGLRRCGAGDEQLAMALADQEELKATGVQAGVHLQLNGSGRGPRASDRPERSPHFEGRSCRPGGVLLALVEQEKRVSPELEESASLRVCDSEE